MKLFFQRMTSANGSLAIEFAIIISIFIMMLALMVDFGLTSLKQSKLERVTTSMASIFRERMALYNNGDNSANGPSVGQNIPSTLSVKEKAEQISQGQVDVLAKLAMTLLNVKEVGITVDAIYFAPVSGNDRSKQIKQSVSIKTGTLNCPNSEALSKYVDLSPFSELNRWMPLYRIKTCIRGNNSWYSKLLNNEQTPIMGIMQSSNIVLPR